AIAREDQPPGPPVPNRQREHPPQPGKDPRPPGVPAIDYYLRVAAAAERVAERLELAPDLGEIVDLAVVGDPAGPVRARHRLMGGGREVDDRETSMRETGTAISPHAFIIRPAVPQCADHRPEPRLQLWDRRRCAREQKTADAAH